MRALLTNDDGIDSHALRWLASAAVACGLETIVAAPGQERSGSSAALTGLEADGRLVTQQRSLPELDDVEAYAVEAAPAFIVFSSAYGAFDKVPDVVLSGINLGPNTGKAVLHSGTVGAALTAASYRIPGLAFSSSSSHPSHADTHVKVADRVLRWFLAADLRPDPVPLVLNVNIPDIPPDELRGVAQAGLAPFGAVEATVGKIGEGFVSLTIADVDVDYPESSDAALLEAGWATVTPLEAPCESRSHDLTGLADPR